LIRRLTYILLFALLALFSLAAINRSTVKETNKHVLNPDPFRFLRPDTIELIYPFANPTSVTESKPESPLFLKEPSNVQQQVEYDPETNEYTIKEKMGKLNYRTPYSMTATDYMKWDQERALQQYWRERAISAGQGASGTGLIPQIYIGGEIFEKIFGSGTIDIRPQGSAELTFGVLANKREDPTLSVRQQNIVNFDFQQRIQMSVLAKIGDKIEFQTNYNTEASFEFENKLNLKYEGKEDEIIQLIEAGNVTLPLNSTLITGSQALFGIKTKTEVWTCNCNHRVFGTKE
jgi:cell surface protein SprA